MSVSDVIVPCTNVSVSIRSCITKLHAPVVGRHFYYTTPWAIYVLWVGEMEAECLVVFQNNFIYVYTTRMNGKYFQLKSFRVFFSVCRRD